MNGIGTWAWKIVEAQAVGDLTGCESHLLLGNLIYATPGPGPQRNLGVSPPTAEYREKWNQAVASI